MRALIARADTRDEPMHSASNVGAMVNRDYLTDSRVKTVTVRFRQSRVSRSLTPVADCTQLALTRVMGSTFEQEVMGISASPEPVRLIEPTVINALLRVIVVMEIPIY